MSNQCHHALPQVTTRMAAAVLVAIILILLAALLVHHFGGFSLSFHVGYFHFFVGVS